MCEVSSVKEKGGFNMLKMRHDDTVQDLYGCPACPGHGSAPPS